MDVAHIHRFKLVSAFEAPMVVRESFYFPCILLLWGIFSTQMRWSVSYFCSVTVKGSAWDSTFCTLSEPLSPFALCISAYPCLHLFCKSHLKRLGFPKVVAWKSWHSWFPRTQAQIETLPQGADFTAIWYSKTLKARRPIAGRCKTSCRLWAPVLPIERSTP